MLSGVWINTQADNRSLESLDDVKIVVKRDPQSGFISAFNVVDGAVVQPYNGVVSDDSEGSARAFLQDFGEGFGLQGSALDLWQPERLTPASVSRQSPSITTEPVAQIERSRTNPQVSSVRFSQRKNGLPVYGSGVIVRVDDNNDVVGGSFRVSTVDDDSRQITISKSSATNQARNLVAAIQQLPSDASIFRTRAELVIFNPYLLGTGRNVEIPAWYVRFQIGSSPERDSEVLIDAGNGHVLLLNGHGGEAPLDPSGFNQEPSVQTRPAPLYPSNGSEINGSDLFPEFQWQAHSDAASYVLFVSQSDAQKFNAIEVEISEPHLHCTVHANSICSVAIPGVMVDGAHYTWRIGKRVLGQNTGVVQWSRMQTFIYARHKLLPAAMHEADLISPYGEQSNTTLNQNFYWRNPGASEWFRLLVTDHSAGRPRKAVKWISASDAGCDSASGLNDEVCTAVQKDYRGSGAKSFCWSVTPWNELGIGNPSPPRCFFYGF